MSQLEQNSSSTPAKPIDHNAAIEEAIKAQGAAFEGMATVAFEGLIKRLKEVADAKREKSKER